MDVIDKAELISRPPTEEVVTHDELVNMLETNSKPKHYIGLEISGFLHLGSLVSTGFKINDFLKAGVDCTIFLADWHTMINDKLGGNWETISKVSQYYRDAFKLVCPGANILLGSDLYDSRGEYWKEFVKFTKHMSLKRTMRSLTIMGRSEDESKVDLAKLLYPPMQAVDIHSMDLDLVHAGMDQRKIHMLVREIFPKMGWKVPIAVHHKLLPGLSKPAETSTQGVGKMSKSDPNSGIFIHDTDEVIRKKIAKSWCEVGNTENNPLLEIARTIIFRDNGTLKIERPEKYGGNVEYADFAQLETDFAAQRLHPTDLKGAVGEQLVGIISPIRAKLNMSRDIFQAITNSH